MQSGGLVARSARGEQAASSNRSDYGCYLIASERPSVVAQLLGDLGLHHEIVDAVDCRRLPISEIGRLTAENRYYQPLQLDEISGYLSQLNALEYFVASGKPYALILQDVVAIPDTLDSILRKAIRLRESGTVGVAGMWHVLHLAGAGHHRVQLAEIEPGTDLVEDFLRGSGPLTAALWHRSGACAFLYQFNHLSRPIDQELQHPWEYGLRVLSVFPPKVIAKCEVKTKVYRPIRKLRYDARRTWLELRLCTARYGFGSAIGLVCRLNAHRRHLPIASIC